MVDALHPAPVTLCNTCTYIIMHAYNNLVLRRIHFCFHFFSFDVSILFTNYFLNDTRQKNKIFINFTRFLSFEKMDLNIGRFFARLSIRQIILILI